MSLLDCRIRLAGRGLALGMALVWAFSSHVAGAAGYRTEAISPAMSAHVSLATVADEEAPSFGLPPIVVQLRTRDGQGNKTISFKAALIFDEVDWDRIEDSMRVTKTLMPRIVDSVISGIQNRRFETPPDGAAVDRLVIEYSNAVLKPYGVVIKELRMQYLEPY
jgi:hypothetical protein